MASGPSTSSIEQDWQEVDDAGSIHSLSSTSESDGELVEHTDNDVHDSNDNHNEIDTNGHVENNIGNGHEIESIDRHNAASSNGATPLHKSNPISHVELPHRPNTATTSRPLPERVDDRAVGVPVAAYGHSPGKRIPISSLMSDREPPQVLDYKGLSSAWMTKDTEASSSSNQHTTVSQTSSQKSADSEFVNQQDVVKFNSRLVLLRALLNEVVRETGNRLELYTAFRIPVVYRLHDTVSSLQEQVDELTPIVAACAEHIANKSQKEWMDPADLPFNANLPQWAEKLRVSLLGLQVTMDTQLRFTGGNGTYPPTPPSQLGNFSKSADGLERLHNTMTDFLPIIKSDYCDFRTQHMSMPTSAVPIPGRQRTGGVDPTVSTLRKTFYSLRDEIRKVLDLVVEIHSYNPASPIAKDAPRAIRTLSNLRDAIMLILTNNPSEWIESDLNAKRKILSYPAFIALSPDMLDDVTSQMAQVREDLDVPIDAENPRKIVYRHQIALLTEGGHLEEIYSTACFLESLLVPKTESGRSNEIST